MNENVIDSHDEELVEAIDNRYLTFRIGAEIFGIEISHVTEIVGVQKITAVPELPDAIRGVINLRGRVIPVLDVRWRFGRPARAYDDRTCIIVVSINNESTGLIVDFVNEVQEIPTENISDPPRTGSDTSGQYIQGMGKHENDVIILLDVTRLLDEPVEDESLTT